MDQYISYPRHKDCKKSGVAWLGNIPSDWGVTKLRYEMTLINGAAFKPSDWGHEGVPIVRIQNLNGSEDYNRVKESRRIDPKYHLEKGDIVFSWSGNVGTSFGAFRWEKDFKAYLNQHIFKVTSFRNYSSRFLYWLLKAVTAEVESNTHGIFGLVHITKGELGATPLPVVPQATQGAIANFLDQKTAEIDKAIAKKQHLIELLKEQKAILINQAVTKGLNPDAPKRDSGVEWIGEVPVHWTVKRAKYLFCEVDERSTTGQEELLSVSHMTGVTPRSEKNVYMFMAEDYSGSKLCQKDDLVFNIMWAWMGALGVSDRTGIVSPSYGIYRQQQIGMFNPWYLEHLLRSGQYVAEYNRRSTGLHSSRLRLYSHMFFDMEIGFPSRTEQDLIEQTVGKKTKYIDQTAQAVSSEIEKLSELRDVIIAEAVTGKIKL